MADGISREEKLAAGLKRLKQFQQQRSAKAKTTHKKSTQGHRNSYESLPEDQMTEESSKTISQVPPPFDLESSKSHSTANVRIISSDSGKEIDSSTVQKSQSDLQLSNTKDFSSTESLRQISQQVNGLMSETNAFLNGEPDESPDPKRQSLEKRNQELALLVNNLRQSNDQLQFQLQEVKGKQKRLSQSFEQERKDLQEKSHKEQVTLKDQLQVHIQTIGILVAEKTELQSSLALSQQTAKQKAGEVEELQGRLRGSRHRASELERDINAFGNANQQLEKANKESLRELERIKLDLQGTKKSSEEYRLANSELTEKLNRKISDLQAVEKELLECRQQLSEVQVEQLSTTEGAQNRTQLEEVYQQKLELEQRISHHKDSISKLIVERDQTSERYQQYISQLSQQVTSLRDEVKQHCTEEEQLLKQKDVLQEQLEALQQQNPCLSAEDPSELKVQISILRNQNEELNHRLQAEMSTQDSLSKELVMKEEQRACLEKTVFRLREEHVDRGRLAEAMQSDKVAASRAMTQNRDLKKQLEELQTVFVTMSNDKLTLVEELDSQKHIVKELGERLSQQEKELGELQEQLCEREEELRKVHASSSKGLYQQNQIADRMRHYEAQGQLTDLLQKELHQAQEQIRSVTNQNSDLRMALATQAEVASSDEKDSYKRNDLVESLSASVRQLEMERNQMMQQLEEQKSSRLHLQGQLETHLHEDGSDVVSKKEYAMIKNAMAQLEERFTETMNRIAALTDERQQLEHLVTQLQGETETIGDYIALYQIQRGLMRKRASEKDDYIAQLATDREDLKDKLGELQNLVRRLLDERKQFQTAESIDLIHVPNINGLPEESIEDTKSESDSVFSEPKTENTAKKIMKILSEIESTNLVEKPVLDNFHPCSVCSGRLLTV